MPVLASNTLPVDEYPRAKKQIAAFKTYLQSRRPGLVAGTTADEVLSLYFDSVRFRGILSAVAAVPGIVAFAKDQENDQAYEPVTEFNALVTAVDAVLTEIETTYPTDGEGYLLDRKLVSEAIEQRSFTGAQLATLVTLVDAVIAAIT